MATARNTLNNERLWSSTGDGQVDALTPVRADVSEGDRLDAISNPELDFYQSPGLIEYGLAAAAVAVCCLVGWVARQIGLSETNIAMFFLAAVVIAAARIGRGPAIATSILGVLAFDYFFVAPIFTFARSDTQYIVTLLTMMGIGILISTLTTRWQSQLRRSQEHEHRTAALYHASRAQERRTAQLYEMTRQLSELTGNVRLLSYAGEQLARIFDATVMVVAGDSSDQLEVRFGNASALNTDPRILDAARWVAKHRRSAGLGTDERNDLTVRLVPMIGSQGLFGVLVVSPSKPARFSDLADCRMLDTCASLIALSIERDLSRAEAHQAQLKVQSETFRNALLSSVSHDMRTPLAMIAVTASGLMDDSVAHSEAEKREMLETVVDESNRLARQVDNLLEMARLNAGALTINRQWHVLEELVGVALSRLKPELQKYKVNVDIPEDFPLLFVADDLLEQVFLNLLENAVRYTPLGSRMDISARIVGANAEIRFSDNGPGLPPMSESKVFEPFFRGRSVVADGQRGMGIGLAICHGLVHAQGGSITAGNRTGGGAEFVITLPCQHPAPQVDLDDTVAATLI